MINFTKRYVNTVSLIISIILFCFLNNNILSMSEFDFSKFFISNKMQIQIEQIQNQIKDNADNFYNNEQTNIESNILDATKTISNTENSKNKESTNTDTKDNEIKNTVNWQVEIPAINLKAEISEGTTKEIMDEYVGHFEETSKDEGNVGLAAHNRGYKVNYFQGLKKLKEGDEIIYTYNGKKRKYEIKTHKIIKDTDWTFLEGTEDNRITLITCVENEPEYRRCIQAVEIK